jgi:uncharacterized protein YjbI with pentapeptide repeats
MKKILLLYICFFCFWFDSLSQVKTLHLPKGGNYKEALFLNNESYRIYRPKSNKIEDISIHFKNIFHAHKSTVTDSLNLTFSLFDKSIYFDEVSFTGNIYFGGSYFLDDANFHNATFNKYAFFSHSQFFKDASFGRVQFKSGANFSESDFKGKVSFWGNFDNGVDFSKSNFHNSGDFRHSYFRNYANFSDSNFEKDLNFEKANFDFKLNFSKIHGNGKILLRETQMPTIVNFNDVNLSKTDFREVKIDSIKRYKIKIVKNNKRAIYLGYFKKILITESRGIVDSLYYLSQDSLAFENDIRLLQLINKEKKCLIQLRGTNLETIILPYDRFIVDTVGYSNEEKTTLYEKLIKTCKDEGMQESIKGWDIELTKIQFSYKYPLIAGALIWINEYWWDFGYYRGKIFRNTGIAWGVSFLIFFLFMPFFARVYFPTHLSMQASEAERLKINSWLRLKVALFYTSLIFFSWKMEHSEVNYRNHPWGALIVYIIFTLGIIHLAYLAGAVISN